MTTRDELIKLAKVTAHRQRTLEGIGMVNIWGQTPEQRIDLDAACKVARDEWLMAEEAYRTALRSYVPEAD